MVGVELPVKKGKNIFRKKVLEFLQVIRIAPLRKEYMPLLFIK